MSHKYDFLTVGCMGHTSSIALGVAINKPNRKVWCIDGDGSVLMHMGALAVIGNCKPKNLIHIVINNGAHETVGGMPTVAGDINLSEIATSCGYVNMFSVSDFSSLDDVINICKKTNELSFVEIKSSIQSRSDLGRPKSSSIDNRINFENYIREI